MKARNKGQDGFAMLYVVLLMTALLLMIGAAMALIDSTHRQNAKDKQELAAKAGKFQQPKQ